MKSVFSVRDSASLHSEIIIPLLSIGNNTTQAGNDSPSKKEIALATKDELTISI